ncbi:anhydro-N-acetylmuramic acid kinase [Roseinatronobacter thiooxidans]|uniref:Anhydro-N-acetylmuramic acid kinase n=1 Tax=Roseinatronobacter thiooxidans TaxID=121821 RepID=A0A2W7SA42_9RHOB|nr:anhydro-N-acetylmuramic acid kinase [Roseinatronobacter thiooxidans]PZX47422.1 anhydro-N-acetylmuramic acid kinase [Roseinatronobacter thiooxidans]
MLKSEIKRVLGLMSGTSFDGVDAAVLETDGEVIHAFGQTAFRPYSNAERAALRAVMGCWPDAPEVEEAAEIIESAHAEVMAQFDGVELAGFHGQTLAHDPRGRGTHQAGSGAVLAMVAGYPVVWDFRSADVRLGGQGAPLAPFYHFALAQHIGADAPLVFLNLGGVGNLTWVDPRKAKPDAPGALLAFDTGPANAPMDDLCHTRLGLACDKGGAMAATGTVDRAIVDAFLDDPYFFRVPPKSLDRSFAAMQDRVAHLSDVDALATLAECCAASVAAGVDYLPQPPARVLVCGGGRHNTDLMARIAAHLPCPVDPVEAVGLDGDMIEAQAFAYLAMRVARGLPTSCPTTTGVAASVGGGQISAP